jgi:hypothetical protein
LKRSMPAVSPRILAAVSGPQPQIASFAADGIAAVSDDVPGTAGGRAASFRPRWTLYECGGRLGEKDDCFVAVPGAAN